MPQSLNARTMNFHTSDTYQELDMARALSHRIRLCFLAKKHSKGFTLIELLVAMLVGGIITTILLSLVVGLLQTNQREASRSETQRETQMALDYIARDLREAVYVYDGTCLIDQVTPPIQFQDPVSNQITQRTCRGLLNFLPPTVAGIGTGNASTKPVLAFWKVEDLPKPLQELCQRNANEYLRAELPDNSVLKNIPCPSGKMYTLIVYTLVSNEGSNSWQGKARIMRYKLPQFLYGSTSVTDGWVYPVSNNTSFETWPAPPITTIVDDINTFPKPDAPPKDGDGTYQVLTDFVDTKGLVDTSGNELTDETKLCPQPAPSVDSTTGRYQGGYQITPNATVAGGMRGFYVCVNGSESNGKLNQEVIVHIQGNAAGKPGVPRSVNISFPMQTRVLTRGVANKSI
jgi:prepilin-type N-terminal cleavage/methylation domain-containing protein